MNFIKQKLSNSDNLHELQKLQFPLPNDQHPKAYVSGNSTLMFADEVLSLRIGQVADFGTFHNAFSANKWHTYTAVDRVSICLDFSGSICVTLYAMSLTDKDNIFQMKSTEIKRYMFNDSTQSGIKRQIVVEFPPIDNDSGDLYCFEVVALSDSVIYGGCYVTDCIPLREVRLGLCICTYKREQFVLRNLGLIADIENVYAFVADNGQTLLANYQSELIELTKKGNINVFNNDNTGGAGGFSRAIVEAIKADIGLTNLIIMDDDIEFRKETIFVTMAFLRYIKDTTALIGGAMIELDDSNLLHAKGEHWDIYGIWFCKTNIDLTERKSALVAEREEFSENGKFDPREKVDFQQKINHGWYIGWWYCVIPVEANTVNNLAIPIFFQFDDIDYSIRNTPRKKITLNAISVKHEKFTKRTSLAKDYYALRNRLIISAIHSGKFGIGKFKLWFALRMILWSVVKNLLVFRYNGAELSLRTGWDFLRGLDGIAKLSCGEYNAEIMALNYKLVDMSADVITKVPQKSVIAVVKKPTLAKLFSLFCPVSHKKSAVASFSDPLAVNYVGVGEIVNVDDFGKGFAVRKSVLQNLKYLVRAFGLAVVFVVKWVWTCEGYKKT